MKLEGMHHITMITGEAQKNVEFYAIYFRQPQGILFEIATTSPGVVAAEDPDHLGHGDAHRGVVR